MDLRHPNGHWFDLDEACDWALENYRRLFPAKEPAVAPVVGRKLKSVRRVLEPGEEPIYHGRGYVYFLWIGSAIKIGFSQDPHRRFADISTMLPAKPRLFAWAPGYRRDEKRLHRRLQAQRLRGEWFNANKTVLDVMFMFLREQVEIENLE